MSNLENIKLEYFKNVQKINDLGYGFDIYDKNISILESSVDIEDFLKKYTEIVNEGINVIDLEQFIMTPSLKPFYIRKPYNVYFNLDRLILESWKVLNDYALAEIETIHDLNND